MMWQVCLLPQCLATLKALCFHQPEKGKGSCKRYCLPVRLQKLPASKQRFFFPGPGNMWKTCAVAFVGTPCWSFRAWGVLSENLFSKWNSLHGQRLDLESTFWRHWVGTVAILAQGIHWALIAKQAFLQDWPRFDSSRVHVCVPQFEVWVLGTQRLIQRLWALTTCMQSPKIQHVSSKVHRSSCQNNLLQFREWQWNLHKKLSLSYLISTSLDFVFGVYIHHNINLFTTYIYSTYTYIVSPPFFLASSISLTCQGSPSQGSKNCETRRGRPEPEPTTGRALARKPREEMEVMRLCHLQLPWS